MSVEQSSQSGPWPGVANRGIQAWSGQSGDSGEFLVGHLAVVLVSNIISQPQNSTMMLQNVKQQIFSRIHTHTQTYSMSV